MSQAARVWAVLVGVSLLTQCGMCGREALTAWRSMREDAEWAARDRAHAPPPIPEASVATAPVAPPYVPSVPAPSVLAPPPTQLAPTASSVPPVLHTGPLTLAEMTRDDVTARAVAAGVTLSSNDPMEAGLIASFMGFDDGGSIYVLLIDCARSGVTTCSANEQRTIVGQPGSDDGFFADRIASVHGASDVARLLRGAHLESVEISPMDDAWGIRWVSVDGYGPHALSAYVRELGGVARHHGVVYSEGNATLVVATDGSTRASVVLASLLGHAP